MHCNVNFLLSQKLANKQDNNQTVPPLQFDEKEQQPAFVSGSFFEIKPLEIPQLLYCKFQIPVTNLHSPDIFHPPIG